MAHFCWYLKVLFLLLMLGRCRARPTSRQSELIAGNEFLKLFLDHDEQQRSLHSGENEGRADSARIFSGRSLEHKTRFRNGDSQREAEDETETETGGGKQVVKLVTTGSKIVFLEDAPGMQPKSHRPQPRDEVKVVAVSVSSSSKRGGRIHRQGGVFSSPTSTTTTTRTTTSTTPTVAPKIPREMSDFINRSHKSELSIEEAEPLTMHAMDGGGGGDIDSLNSASNIQNVLASPLIAAASTRSAVTAYHNHSGRNATTPVTTKVINTTNHTESHSSDDVDTHAANADTVEVEVGHGDGDAAIDADDADGSEDKLLPFQTVIYHDTKQGHGPQSRSISYSSISQNVDDLQTWQRSGGILAEAQRNVSEILKPIGLPSPRTTTMHHSSEPAKFYSVPAKMYGIPSKIYGHPSKYYSEPSRIYSQPSKVYGEPAKTYWPQSVTAATTTSTTTTTTTTTTTPLPTTSKTTIGTNTFMPSRRPAIVSRIAFGEANSATATTTSRPTYGTSTTSIRPATWQHHYHHHHQHQHQQQQPNNNHNHHNNLQQQQQQGTQPPRRILFNLDKLPYDLLNAPQQSSRHLLEPILSKTSTEPTRQHHQYQQQQQHQQYQPYRQHQLHQQQHHNHQQQQQQPPPQEHQRPHHRQSPARLCWEQQQQQQQQHSSVSTQHSNQNAKGLPNRDLVKCVSKFAHQHAPSASPAGTDAFSYSSSSTSSSYSSSASASSSSSLSGGSGSSSSDVDAVTDRTELYTPTPEQNYEIEESVSVMTNGRVHGVQGGGGGAPPLVTATTLATPTTTTPLTSTITTAAMPRNRNRGVDRGRGSVVYNANANANDYDDGGGGGGGGDGDGGDDGVDDSTRHGGSGGGGGGNGGGSGGGDLDDDDKVAYVVEGRNYRKYRVEEKTDDGFIVGEYGVVDHNDGNLRGVRYTADSTINRSLLQKALLTFLKLK